jgi:hypothetical protein
LSRIVQSPRSSKQPDTLGVETQGRVLVVVLDDVLVEVLELVEFVVRVVLGLVLVVAPGSVVEVVGTTSDSGSPQCASEQMGSLSSSPPVRATRHVLAGSAQWENGTTAMSQSVGISHRGARGSTQMHPAKNSKPIAYA